MHPFNPPAKRRYWIGDVIEALAIVAFIWGLGASLIAIRDLGVVQ